MLHGHRLKLGLSISHLTRVIIKENVCKYSLESFFCCYYSCKDKMCPDIDTLPFLCLLSYFPPSNNRKITGKIWVLDSLKKSKSHFVYCNSKKWLMRELSDKGGGRALASLARGDLSVLGLSSRTQCWLYSVSRPCRWGMMTHSSRLTLIFNSVISKITPEFSLRHREREGTVQSLPV